VRQRSTLAALLLASLPGALAAGGLDCGSQDLYFGCTEARRGEEFIAGCGVHAEGRFLESTWRTYELHSERVLQTVRAPTDGIAQLAVPPSQWFVIEGEILCGDGHAVPYRVLGERVAGRSAASVRTHRYSPDRLAATGNWNTDTQLHFGEFRARALQGLPREN
jgi:hypothetical protein